MLIFVLLAFGVWLRSVSYAYWTACLTGVLALLYGYYGQAGAGLLRERLAAVALGAAIGLAAAWFVLPVRTGDVLRRPDRQPARRPDGLPGRVPDRPQPHAPPARIRAHPDPAPDVGPGVGVGHDKAPPGQGDIRGHADRPRRCRRPAGGRPRSARPGCPAVAGAPDADPPKAPAPAPPARPGRPAAAPVRRRRGPARLPAGVACTDPRARRARHTTRPHRGPRHRPSSGHRRRDPPRHGPRRCRGGPPPPPPPPPPRDPPLRPPFQRLPFRLWLSKVHPAGVRADLDATVAPRTTNLHR